MITDKIKIFPRLAAVALKDAKVDLVKGWGTCARILRIDWVWSTTINTTIRNVAVVNIMDNETLKNAATATTVFKDTRNISRFSVNAHFDTSGGVVIHANQSDDLEKYNILVVCPISVMKYQAVTAPEIWCNIWYEIIPCSKEKIIEIAAIQGLNLEV